MSEETRFPQASTGPDDPPPSMLAPAPPSYTPVDGGQPRPCHTMTPRLDPGTWAGVTWSVDPCPHDGRGADRDCLWGEEPEGGCAWVAFEQGDHHEACPDIESCERESFNEPWVCWRGREPEECGGFEHAEIGHLHPREGVCGLAESVAIGFEDGWDWSRKTKTPLMGPHMPVVVSWGDGHAEVTPLEDFEQHRRRLKETR